MPALQHVLLLALDTADWFGHDYVGTEHVLIALARDSAGGASRVLHRLTTHEAIVSRVSDLMGQAPVGPAPDDTAEAAHKRVALRFGPAAEVDPTFPPFTPRVLKVLEMTRDEASRRGDAEPSSEHLLVALVREGGGLATAALQQLNVTAGAVIAATEDHLSWKPLLDMVREAELPPLEGAG